MRRMMIRVQKDSAPLSAGLAKREFGFLHVYRKTKDFWIF